MTKDRILKEIEKRIKQLENRREQLYILEITRKEKMERRDKIDDEIYCLMHMLSAAKEVRA